MPENGVRLSGSWTWLVLISRRLVSPASGASEVTVHVTGQLNAEASGASRVRYRGNPSLGRVDTSGASSVSPLR